VDSCETRLDGSRLSTAVNSSYKSGDFLLGRRVKNAVKSVRLV
jgi:hypothetical protein